jgi:spore germination cell wall hydrolase CwlJ-like protein
MLAFSLISFGALAAEIVAPPTDHAVATADINQTKPSGDMPVVFSPLPLRPGLTDDAIARSPTVLSEDAISTDQRCLAEAIYYEARGEGLKGQEAVAEVIFHRMQSGRYPRTICGVVYQGAGSGHGCQFSFACNGERLSPRSGSSWRRADRLATSILAGLIQLGDTTGNAISFHAADVQPGWGEHLVRTTRIGHHIFYRSASRATRPS